MPIRQLQLQCAKCDAVMPHNQPTPNHVVHAIVSVFLIGLWIPVWIFIALGSGKDVATCVKCGNRRLPSGLATISSTDPPKADVRGLLITVALVAIVGAAALIYTLVSSWIYEPPSPSPRPTAEATPTPDVVIPDADPVWWRDNLLRFLDGKGVRKPKIDVTGNRYKITTNKCGPAKDAVEQLGRLPRGFFVECIGNDGVREWTIE